MAPVNEITRFICLFHSADRARAAVSALEELGFARESISTLGAGANPTSVAGPEKMSDLGVPDRDLKHLQDGLRRGGVLLALEAPENRSHEIERIFHRYSADKIDETERETAEAEPLAGYPVGESTGEEAVLPVVEEELNVGKREVDRGGVRVYRRTVERPVQQDVNLHGERVVLQYREVNRPVTEADLRAGTQEIELVETAEVPVVQKVTRVVEEVRVGKVETDRTEVVEDTVRHTEVDVQPIDGRISRDRD